ncbi:hypothetical protein LUZ63_005538 [Rhynchospora breviuscula]|uniref:Dirigent protein n=1 Tax=Rhynchospora breviuscula TaxID=2022672 RepID=A0A9Q0CN41_9POAL|nr:hypothetical protein LUZ63_005538 [Rhynchospora breviuscula]
MESGDYYKIIPRRCELKYRLYVHRGDVEVVAGVLSNAAFGTIVVNDWAAYDSLDSNKKLIARVQGTHTHAESNKHGNYFDNFRITFIDGSFKGSTLQVRGDHILKPAEWAIVGGSGEFTFAQGMVNKTLMGEPGQYTIVQIDIYAIYTPPTPSPEQA